MRPCQGLGGLLGTGVGKGVIINSFIPQTFTEHLLHACQALLVREGKSADKTKFLPSWSLHYQQINKRIMFQVMIRATKSKVG